MLKNIAILLNGGNVAANFVCALDILFEERAVARQQGQLLLRALRRRQVPSVDAEGHVGGNQQHQQQDNEALFKFEIVGHQLLAYTTVSWTWRRSKSALPCCGSEYLSLISLKSLKAGEFSSARMNLSFASSLTAPIWSLTSTRPFSWAGSMLTKRTPAGRIFSKTMKICFQFILCSVVNALSKMKPSFSLPSCPSFY